MTKEPFRARPLPLRMALRDAVHAFLLARRGWRIVAYDLPLHPDYGRNAGRLSRWLPLSPALHARSPDAAPSAAPSPVTWRLSSGGDSFREAYPSPLDAINTRSFALGCIHDRYTR